MIEELENRDTTEIFVWLVERADLSAAVGFSSKAEKRQFVYDTVRTTAEKTQAQLTEFLDSRSLRYRPFYIANKIMIHQSDLELLYQVAGRADVAKITANHQFKVLVLPVADLTVEKIDLIDPVQPGENIAYQITIVNQEPEDALNVVLTGQPEYNFALVTASAGCNEDVGKIVCRIPYVTSGGTITIVIVLEPIDVVEILMNQVTLASDSEDTYPEDNFDSESTMVQIEAEFLTLIPIVLR